MAAAFGLQTLGILMASAVTSPWMLIPYAVVFGIGWGAPIPVRPALQAEYFGLESLGTTQ
ncbi:MAG: hypothetical protein NTZ05_10320 [Chloroflexi bacterium]|nr:hypothetical protein [Chloroflexota bacterium]